MRTHTTNRRGGLLLTGVAAVALMGGTAFTGSNAVENATTPAITGYGSTTVSGATLDALDYNFVAGSDKAIIDTVELTFATAVDAAQSHVEVYLSNTGGTTESGAVTCIAAAEDADRYSCDVNFETANLDKISVSVTGTAPVAQ